jgi:hypothetical protein
VLGVDGDAVAICIRDGRGDDGPHRNVFELSDSLQNVAHLPPFNSELMFVIDVLITATATATEIGALWIDAMGRAFLEIDKFRIGELLFLTRDLRRDHLAIDRKRNKNSLAILATDAFAAESDVFDFKIDDAQGSMLPANHANRRKKKRL